MFFLTSVHVYIILRRDYVLSLFSLHVVLCVLLGIKILFLLF